MYYPALCIPVDRQHGKTTAGAVILGLVTVLSLVADGIKRANGSVGAATGAEGGRHKHKTQHDHGYPIRGMASQVVLVNGEGHPEPSKEGAPGHGGRCDMAF